MKTKFILIIVALIAASGFAQDKTKPGTSQLIIPESSIYSGTFSTVALAKCKAHNKHGSVVIRFADEEGKPEQYKMCVVDYYRGQVQVLKNAGVQMEKE